MRRLLFFIPLVFIAHSAVAQEDMSALSERLERLERDVTFVQKQVYRSGGSSAAGGQSGAMPANAGQLQVRLSQIDEEMRQIRGLIENSQFESRRVAMDLKKLTEDVDYRLRALEQKQTQAAPVAQAPVVIEQQAEAEAVSEEVEPAAAIEAAAKSDPAKPKVTPAITGKDFPNSNAHYSYAFKLLNEKKFAEAAMSFDGFVKKYPADPLTANAFYWLGESQYARGDYTRATESFRKGFEVNADGQKAPDNLYKLALSLNQIKRKKEACVVLARVIEKYSETATRTATKAEEARISMQCK
jgi:tol-pal system protein YbgF